MIYLRKLFHAVLLILILPCLIFAAAKDYTVLVSAAVQKSPAQIVLSWPLDGTATGYTIYRVNLGTTTWGSSIASLPGNATGYTDSTVAVGTAYEYQVAKAAPKSGEGYICSGIEVPFTEDRGKVILLVDNTIGLTSELGRLENDLLGDGWTVIRHDVSPASTVVAIKSLIAADYALGGIKSIFIFGHVPVPYSGQIAPDGHGDHIGAWPTDGYYADMTGTWTDSTVNVTSASDPRNHNIPGDGKFDQSSLPATLELEIGRVDLAKMPVFGASEPEMLKQYLDKDHNFRHRITTATRRGLVDDNFGEFGGEAFAGSGWGSFAPMFGASNINEVDWFTTLAASDYLWGYGCGPGSFTSCSGVGTTTNFVNTDTKVVFTMLFGSYFGDWDSTNNFLRAPLGTRTYGLSSVWSGRPWWYFHYMALGETIGYSNRRSMLIQRQSHMGLMGDPTLRMHPVKPITNLQATENGTDINLTWNASSDTNIVGYNVYRADNVTGPYTKANSGLVTATNYTDAGGIYYMVRAIKLETGSGTYFNGSQGVFTSSGASGADPFVNMKGYPNPVNVTTGGTFKVINLPADTTMNIYSVSGELVRTLQETDFGNTGSITWNGKNNAGEIVARGVYLYVVTNPAGRKRTAKIALLK